MALCYKAEMDSEAAAERLQVIRTLMERSAVYRRALAPIMLFLGVLGILSSVAGTLLPMNTPARFLLYWLAISATGLAGAFVLARREALRDKEAFWSPPTRRVAQALFPPLVTGGIAGVIIALSFGADKAVTWALPVIWIFFYGCAVHAAGFFMPRGMKMLGILFILGGASLTLSSMAVGVELPLNASHVMMGVFFGGLHLAYGIYLNMTEKPVQTTK